MTPVQRPGTVEEQADTALFLEYDRQHAVLRRGYTLSPVEPVPGLRTYLYQPQILAFSYSL